MKKVFQKINQQNPKLLVQCMRGLKWGLGIKECEVDLYISINITPLSSSCLTLSPANINVYTPRSVFLPCRIFCKMYMVVFSEVIDLPDELNTFFPFICLSRVKDDFQLPWMGPWHHPLNHRLYPWVELLAVISFQLLLLCHKSPQILAHNLSSN